MSEKTLRIMILEGRYEPSAFVKRLIAGLAEVADVTIIGVNDRLTAPIPGVRYLCPGSSVSKWRFIKQTLRIELQEPKVSSLWTTFKLLLTGQKTLLRKRNLKKLIRYYDPDILHIQWYAGILYFEAVVSDLDCKIILSQRGYQTNVRPFIKEEYLEGVRRVLSLVDGFHSVSRSLSLNGDRLYTHNNKIDHIVHTGLDLSEFRFRESYNQNTPLRILSIGRDNWVKGYEYALRSMEFIKQSGMPFKYEIVGGKGAEELAYLIEILGLERNVELTGRITQSQVMAKMIEADLVLVSSFEEGIANVAVEAMALGTPVITTDCGGMSELIDDGISGWLVPVGEPEMLAKQILNFQNLTSEQIEEVRTKARSTVEERFTATKMVEGMFNLYKAVMHRFDN